MNIENLISSTKVYVLKLSTGEEIITRIQPLDNNFFSITKPMTVAFGPNGVQLMPSLFTANHDDIHMLHKDNIVMMAEAKQEVSDSYIESVTGIQPISKKILHG